MVEELVSHLVSFSIPGRAVSISLHLRFMFPKKYF